MGPMGPIFLMYGSHDMRHVGFRRLTVVNGTPGSGCHSMPCHDTTSMSGPKLIRNLEYLVVTWEPPSLSKSVTIENSLS